MIKLNFDKMGGLIPAIVQDSKTNKVLMLGYMNSDAYEKTKAEGKVTFYSRSKERLWTKGETSGNFLFVKEMIADCDNDTILIKAQPHGYIRWGISAVAGTGPTSPIAATAVLGHKRHQQ